jgi:hypothetical protein
VLHCSTYGRQREEAINAQVHLERNFAEQLEMGAWRESNPRIEQINDAVGVKWIF